MLLAKNFPFGQNWFDVGENKIRKPHKNFLDNSKHHHRHCHDQCTLQLTLKIDTDLTAYPTHANKFSAVRLYMDGM